MRRTLHFVIAALFVHAGAWIRWSQPQAPAAEVVPARPIWISSWKPVWRVLPHVTPMLWLGGYLTCTPNPSDKLPDAEQMAQASAAIPEGRRVLLWYRYFTTFWSCPEDEVRSAQSGLSYRGPWSDVAMSKVEEEWSRWLLRFQRSGGQLDYLIGDCEDWSKLTNWWLKPDQLAAIRGDPRFREAKYGLAPLSEMLKGVNLDLVLDTATSSQYLGWNLQISRMSAAEMIRSVWDPALRLFPKLRGANYGGLRDVVQPAPDPNGHPQPLDNVFGTSPSPVAYGSLLQASTSYSIDPANPTRLIRGAGKRLPQDAWGSFLIDQQQGRAARRGMPDRPLLPWIASRTFTGDDGRSIGYPKDPRYYIENIVHYALLGTEVFLWWNPVPGGNSPAMDEVKGMQELAEELERVMVLVNDQCGGVVERTIDVSPIRLDSPFVLTGAVCGNGTTLWRVTFRPDIRSYRRPDTGEVRTLPPDSVGDWIRTTTNQAPAIEITPRP
jgi:hypothetical protein